MENKKYYGRTPDGLSKSFTLENKNGMKAEITN